jgi:iron complex transport system substrate-binding protein
VPVLILIVFAFARFLKQAGRTEPENPGDTPAVDAPLTSELRIISLAPSITEILFALDLGDSVVGVTRFCKFPQEASERTDVGGYYDPNYEAMAALRPDLAIVMPEHETVRNRLTGMGIETLTVDHRTVAGILDSIDAIGRMGGVEREAEALVRSLKQRMGAVEALTQGLERPRVMLTIERDVNSDRIEGVYLAGNSGWLDELIRLAGGVNAYRGPLAFPEVSAEGILNLNPDVIVEMLGDLLGQEPEERQRQATRAWQRLPSVNAVKHDRVHILTEQFVIIPGPRFILILENLARILHPDAPWPAHQEHRATGPVPVDGLDDVHERGMAP